MRGRLTKCLVPAAVLAAAVAGCGFEPLHGPAVNTALNGIDVTPIQGRAGELLYRALVDRLHPGGRAPRPTGST